MKKAIFGIILSILVLVIYLFWSDFSLVKKLVGYNVPLLTDYPPTKSHKSEGLDFLTISEGFNVSVIAKDLINPRVILFDSKGRMLVSETKAGRVSILEGPTFKKKRTLVDGLKLPHGLDFFKDTKTETTYLYIAETHQVARYAYDVVTGKLTDTVGKNITNLPADGRHFTRTITFGPNFRKSQIVGTVNTQVDTKLYMSVGSSCDVCEESTWKRAAILEADPEGGYTAEFAGGLRNSVFFAFHPKTKEIWATEMGRDDLGDNLPPDEVNIIKVAGPEDKFGAKRYGWPFCYGDKVKDKTFNPEKINRTDISSDCTKTESPVIQIPAHSAPLGLAFIPTHSASSGQANKWPSEWQNDLLVAYHGSWNSSKHVGYKIVRYNLDANGNVLSQKPVDFISGWLGENGKISGRPVDLKFGADGALYISDDTAGLIYRVMLKP